MSHKKSKTKKAIIVTVLMVLLIVAVGAFGLWEHHNKSNSKNNSQFVAQTHSTITTPPTQHSISNSSSGAGQGGVIDQNGKSSNSTSETQSTTSSSGNITLYQPSKNELVSPGATLSGIAKISKVQFMLIDNESGLLAQGQLNVVDGKFSGLLQFKAQSSAGRLDVYSSNGTGAEINLIEIPVKFNP